MDWTWEANDEWECLLRYDAEERELRERATTCAFDLHSALRFYVCYYDLCADYVCVPTACYKFGRSRVAD